MTNKFSRKERLLFRVIANYIVFPLASALAIMVLLGIFGFSIGYWNAVGAMLLVSWLIAMVTCRVAVAAYGGKEIFQKLER